MTDATTHPLPLLWGYRSSTYEWVLGRWMREGTTLVVTDVRHTYDVVELAAVPRNMRRWVSENAPAAPLPARAFDGPPGQWLTMTCAQCWMVSHNPNDTRERYCGNCHGWPEADLSLRPRTATGRAGRTA